MCISDLSKNLMNDFPYNYIKQKYGNKAKLWCRETDRLVYKICMKIFILIKICLISMNVK